MQRHTTLPTIPRANLDQYITHPLFVYARDIIYFMEGYMYENLSDFFLVVFVQTEHNLKIF